MQTWKKITIVVGILILLAGGYLYLRGAETADQPREGEAENPVFPFEADEGDAFFAEGETSPESSDEVERVVSVNTSSQLWQVSEDSVAGSAWVNRGGQERVWFATKSNGHVFAVDPEDREVVRITNTTIPQAKEVLIAPTGQYIIYRYVGDGDNVKTYLATLVDSQQGAEQYQLDGSFLPDNVSTIDFSPDGRRVFYLQPTAEGVLGVIRDLQTDEAETVFESPIREWRGGWSNTESITLFTAADTSTQGFAYKLSTNRDLEKLAEGRGLTAKISPGGTYMIYGSLESGEYRTRLKDIEEDVILMSSPTLEDKCDWAMGINSFFCGVPERTPTNSLQQWYQGRVSFDDNLVLFNPVNRNQSSLFSEEQLSKGPFDMIDIKTDTGFNNIIFTNKHDGSLWGFSL